MSAVPAPKRANLLITYEGGSNPGTQRRVTFSKSDGYSLTAFCHKAINTRTFLIHRISEAVDLETGEVIANFEQWLDEHGRLTQRKPENDTPATARTFLGAPLSPAIEHISLKSDGSRLEDSSPKPKKSITTSPKRKKSKPTAKTLTKHANWVITLMHIARVDNKFDHREKIVARKMIRDLGLFDGDDLGLLFELMDKEYYKPSKIAFGKAMRELCKIDTPTAKRVFLYLTDLVVVDKHVTRDEELALFNMGKQIGYDENTVSGFIRQKLNCSDKLWAAKYPELGR